MFIWSSFLNVLFDLSAENIAEKHSFSVSTYIKRIKSVKDLAIGKKNMFQVVTITTNNKLSHENTQPSR